MQPGMSRRFGAERQKRIMRMLDLVDAEFAFQRQLLHTLQLFLRRRGLSGSCVA